MGLELNSSQMGMRPKGETWEWYTARFEVASVHIHNRTTSGKWIWKIWAGQVIERQSNNEYMDRKRELGSTRVP